MADFTATVNVDINDSQLSSVEQRLDALNNKKISIDLDTKGINNIQSQLNQLNNIKIDKINVNTGTITQTLNRVGINAGRTFANSFKNGISDLNMQKLTTGISELETKFSSLGDKGSAFTKQLATLRTEIENFDKSATPKQQEQMFKNLTQEMNQLNLKYRELNAEAKNAQQSMNLLSGRNTLNNQIQTWMNNNTKAAKAYATQLDQLQTKLKTVSSKGELTALKSEFAELKSLASAEGLTGKGIFGQLFSNISKLSPMFGMGAMIATGVRELKSMYNSVVELDTALVDLQKTSTASASQLNQFYTDANQIAKDYGTTTKQIIQSAADWSRLGYNLQDSKTMSKLSSQFAAISPGVSVEDATSGLVSIMKSYGISAEDALDGIMSKINIVGNSFAVSNGDVLEGLKRSSAAMSAMDQDLDSTVALFTGMNEVLQNAETSGTILRNMALRIRGFDEETEQLSDDLVNINGKIIDYTKTAKNAQGVSIFTDASQTQYKDFITYFNELADAYQYMDAKSRQGLLNDLFGKRGAQGGAAILQNIDTVNAALEKMSNSAGNADAEMEIIQNSIEYKTNALKESFVGIGQNIFQRDTVGGIIDDLTGVVTAVDKVTESVGLLGTIGGGAGIVALIKNFGKIKTFMVEEMALQSSLAAMSGVQSGGFFGAMAIGAKSLLAALAPLAPVIIGVTAALAGFKIFDYVNSGWTRAQERAEEAKNSFNEAQQELDSLNGQRNDNLSKVQEIAAKYNIEVEGTETVDEVINKIESSDKGITLVDEAELSKIQQANSSLDAQIKIQEQLAEARKQVMLDETEAAAQAEKSYWEHVKERHGKGFFGTIAAAWDYATTNHGYYDQYSGQYYEGEGDQFREGGTTNLDLARKSLESLKEQKEELKQLDKEITDSGDKATDAQIKKRQELNDSISETASETSKYLDTVTDEMETLSQSDSDFARNYVKEAQGLLQDFTNIDATPVEKALNNLDAFFDGSAGKNAIKDKLAEAAKEGKDLQGALGELGLSLSDLSVDDVGYLNDYFNDLTKSVEEATEATDNYHKSVEDIEAATKSENQDKDWSTVQGAYKTAKELLEQGKTGTDDFQTMAQFLSPNNLDKLAKEAEEAGGYAADVYQKAFQNAQKYGDRWFSEDETKSMENFVDDFADKGLFNVNKNDDMGLWDIQSNFKTTAEAANEFGTSVEAVETMLHGLEAYGYDFSGIAKSGELLSDYQVTLDALKQTYDSMNEGDAKNKLGQLIEGFDKEYAGFQDDLSNLSEEQVVHIKFEYDLASIQAEIENIRSLIEGGDNSVSNNAQLIATQDKYISTATSGLGLNQEGIKLPVQYEIAADAEANLKEQLKSATSEEEKIELQAEIENQQQIQQDVLDTFAKEHPEITPETDVSEINSALDSTFDSKTITIDAQLNSEQVDKYLGDEKNSTITFTASLDGVETQVQAVRNEDGTITYTANIDGEPTEVDLNKQGEITYKANVTGETDVAEDKSANVNYNVNAPEAPTYEGQEPQVNYALKVPEAPKYPNQDPAVTYHLSAPGTPSYPNLDRYITYHIRTTGSAPSGGGGVDGTAHVRGTAHAYKGSAFAHGDWGTKKGGIALGGELGQELVVRDGKYFTIGDDSAEFFRYKPGDVIFNAEQTKEIFEKGKITHGNKRAEALVEGTAFRLGSGSSSSSSGGGGGSSSGGGGGSSKKKSSGGSKKKSSGSDKSDKKEKERIDWVEVALDRAERAVKRLKTLADSVYRTFSSRNKNLSKEIKKVTSEISLQEKAQKRYNKEFKKAAKEGGLSKGIIKKIKDGSIDITKYGEKTQKAIKEAQTWYNKMLDCKDAVTELNESLSELYQQQFELIVTKWEKALQNLQHTAERVEARIDNRTAYASDYVGYGETRSAATANIKDYRSLVNNAVSQRTKRQSELAALNKDLNSKVKSGKIKMGSEAYYDMLKEIQDVENEIDSLNGSIVDYSNAISEQYRNIFDSWSDQYESKLELIEHTANEVNNALDLAEEKGRLGAAKYYEDLRALENENIKTLTEEREKLQTAFYNALSSGEIEVGSAAYYDMQKAINKVTESLQDAQLEVVKLNNEIRQVKWDNFDYLEERISRVTSEADFLIKLLANDKQFEDNGQLTDAGMSAMGLHGVNYNVYMKQADDYAKQIKAINKDIANDPANTDLIKRREELIDLQQKSILAAEDEKVAIKNLVKEGIDTEIKSLNELISKYKEGLDSQKDLYDYQKRVEEQTKNIATLQKQLGAYSGDISEETKAQVQRIKVELENAREDLEETETDRLISEQKKMLDDLANEYETVLNTRLDDLDALVRDMISQVNTSAGDINKTLTTATTEVGYTMTTEMQTIWSQAAEQLKTNADAYKGVIAQYGADFQTRWTTTNSVLSGISATVGAMQAAAAAEAQAAAAKRQAEADAKKAAEDQAKAKANTSKTNTKPTAKKATTTTTKKKTATTTKKKTATTTKKKTTTTTKKKSSGTQGDGKIQVGDKVKYKSGKYYNDSYGGSPTGSSHKGGQVYVTKINTKGSKPYHISTGKKLGSGDLGWLTKSQISGYALGLKKARKDEAAWVNEKGLETILSPSNRAIITHISKGDAVLDAEATKNLFKMANNPDDYINGGLLGRVAAGSHTGNITNNFGDSEVTLNLPNVKNYEELKAAMQKDKDFDRLITAIAVEPMLGRSKSKNRFNFG